MNQPPKKIVSKGEYAKVQGRRARASLTGLTYLCIAFLCVMGAIAFVPSVAYRMGFSNALSSARWDWLDGFVFLASGHRQPDAFIGALLGNGLIICLLIGTAYLFGLSGFECLQEAVCLDPGIPLTHANTGDLPADTSLVRASEQPVTTQQSVLLRPVVETQDTHEGQLLRPL